MSCPFPGVCCRKSELHRASQGKPDVYVIIVSFLWLDNKKGLTTGPATNQILFCEIRSLAQE